MIFLWQFATDLLIIFSGSLFLSWHESRAIYGFFTISVVSVLELVSLRINREYVFKVLKEDKIKVFVLVVVWVGHGVYGRNC